jgi:Cys-rich protein (TIGR01571 family)
VTHTSFHSHAVTVAAGQVIRRLKLTACGRPGSVAQTEIAFKIIFMALSVYMTIYIGLYLVLLSLTPTFGSSDPYDYKTPLPSRTYLVIFWLRSAWHYIYLIILTAVLFNLRGYVRRRYAIPGSEVQDCCCSFWCPCLVVTQMMRHTTDYDTYPSLCCSETGVPAHAPEIV